MKKLLLITNTIRYLTLTQISYQIWYRIKARFIPFFNYNRFFETPLQQVRFRYPELIPSQGKYLNPNSFCFLNLSYNFKNSIDWNFQRFGKLWNYNLQYFDYLHDAGMPDDYKKELIEDFSQKLISRKVQFEPYPVSLRLINWILYHSHSRFDSNRFKKAVQLQVDYLDRNKEYHLLANHLLENYIALVVAGYALKNNILIERNLEAIQTELEEQILDDGGHYECTPMYHSIILSRLLLLLDIIDQNDWIKPDIKFLINKIENMLGWLKKFQFNNGKLAHFNDSADGIAPEPAKLFELAEKLGLNPAPQKLKTSGYRKLSNNGFDVLVDVGNIIPSYQPGHAHSDMLHFCMNHNNKPVFVDTGTSTYQVNERRMVERKTSSHNTVTVNNEDQSEVWGSFRVGRRATLNLLEDEGNNVSARHNGYLNKFGLIHQRNFKITSGAFIVTDEIFSNSNKSVAAVAHFHFHYTITLRKVDESQFQIGDGLEILFDKANKVVTEEYFQATGFNKVEKAIKLKAYFEGSLITKIFIN